MRNKGIILLCIFLLSMSLSACASDSVPDFVGKNVSEVYKWCSEIDTKYACEVSYAEGNGAEKDIVIEQSIQAGGRLNYTSMKIHRSRMSSSGVRTWASSL